MNTEDLTNAVNRAARVIDSVRDEIGKVVVGQEDMVDGLLMGIIAGGHVLLEGVPGLAKTLAVKTMASVLDADFKRIQFTPDLLPADLIGTMVYRHQTGEFIPRKGPVFSNVVLADEINRAPAKVQSALLEAMQERQVTISNSTFSLPKPFFVLATQNPIEQEGTYPLPEAQLDRFLMKLKVEYPSNKEELAILRRMGVQRSINVNSVLNIEMIEELRKTAESIMVDDKIEEYVVNIVAASREKNKLDKNYAKFIEFGASTRATIALYRCSKIKAMFEGRTFVIPDDIKAVVYNVLRHRIVLSYEAESEDKSADDIIRYLLKDVKVP